jgi:hypothetical protein
MNRQTFDPIQQPTLAYRHAFDWLAVQLQAAGGPVAAVAPSLFHSAEILRRLPRLPLVAPLPDRLPQVAAELGLPAPTELRTCRESLRAVAWTEPATGDVDLLEPVQAALHPGAYLYVLLPGVLGCFLSEHRHGEWGRLLSARRAVVLLRSHGLRIRRRLGLHGLRAVANHYAGLGASGLGRVDWRDRRHFAMRRDFVEPGFAGSRLSALVLIVAEKRP